MSLMCISTLALSGCLAVTVLSGTIGVVDSVAKEIKINKLEKRLIELKKSKEEEDKPYVPSYKDMDILKNKL